MSGYDNRFPRQPFEETEYAVIDFETSGGALSENRIIEIGCVWARGAEVIDTYQHLVNPGVPVHPFVWGLTGLSPLDVDDAPPLDELLGVWLPRIRGIPLFAHNASFDQTVLNGELAMRGIAPFGVEGKQSSYPWICTLYWARRLIPGLGKYKLSALNESLNLGQKHAHRGLDDALATQKLVVHLQRAALRRDWDLFALYTALETGQITPREIGRIWSAENA